MALFTLWGDIRVNIMGFRIQLIGNFAFIDPAGQELRISSKRGRALLSLLALRRGGLSRVWLQDCLWPNRQEQQASNSLRQLLHTLRLELDSSGGSSLLQAQRDQVRLDIDKIAVDILEIDAQLSAGSPISHVPAAQLLEGLDIVDASPFEDWLSRNRSWADDILARARQRRDEQAKSMASEQSAPDPSIQVKGDVRPVIALQRVDAALQQNWHAVEAWLAQSLRSQTSRIIVGNGRAAGQQDPDFRLTVSPYAAPVATGDEPENEGNLWLQLYSCVTDELLWSERVRLPSAPGGDAAFSLLGALAVRIDSVIDRHLRREAVQGDGSGSDVRAMYWRANQLVRYWSRAETIEALDLSRAVLERRPFDDWARAQLALCEAITAFQGWTEHRAASAGRALAHARLCVSSGQDDPYALGTAAFAMVLAGSAPDVAMPIIAHALAINAHMPGTWFWSGWISLAGGQLDQAQAAFRRAMDLNPHLSVRPFALAGLGLVRLLEDDFLAAAPLLLESCALLDAFSPGLAGAAAVLARTDSAEAAMPFMRRLEAAGGRETALAVLRDAGQRARLASLLDAAA
jgi:tetratricopeptide (TPR) repeat protein